MRQIQRDVESPVEDLYFSSAMQMLNRIFAANEGMLLFLIFSLWLRAWNVCKMPVLHLLGALSLSL